MIKIIKGAILITISSLVIAGCGGTSGATSTDKQKKQKPTTQTAVVTAQKSSIDTTSIKKDSFI